MFISLYLYVWSLSGNSLLTILICQFSIYITCTLYEMLLHIKLIALLIVWIIDIVAISLNVLFLYSTELNTCIYIIYVYIYIYTHTFTYIHTRNSIRAIYIYIQEIASELYIYRCTRNSIRAIYIDVQEIASELYIYIDVQEIASELFV